MGMTRSRKTSFLPGPLAVEGPHLVCPSFLVRRSPLTKSTGAGFLEALIAANTTVDFSGIEEIVSNGLRAKDGKFYELDMIVCATGFDIGFIPFFELKGMNGIDIKDTWNPDPK